MRSHATAVLALTVLLGDGCGAQMSNGCGYQLREVAARAQISAPADPRVEYADLSLSQSRGDVPTGPLRGITWLVIAVDLQSHILGARLVDASAGGGTLLELPEQPIVGGTAALAGSLSDMPEAGAFNWLYDLLVFGRVAIELDTDLPGRERIREIFRVTSGGRAWGEPSCS